MIQRDELIKIGQFNKPHGIVGELSFSFTDDIFDRTDCPFFVCEVEGIFVPFFIEEYRFRGETAALVKLQDVNSEPEARAFINKEVYFHKSYIDDDQEELSAPGDFFIGFLAEDVLYGELGTIVAVDDSTVNTLFIIEQADGEELLIPANDDFVVAIDVEKKFIQLNVPEGILDL